MKTPKKPTSTAPKGKPNVKKDDTDEDYEDTQRKKTVDEDEDDFDIPLDDLDTFENFDDDEDDDDF